jgi:sulfopropanediol 3-dehydrogenase
MLTGDASTNIVSHCTSLCAIEGVIAHGEQTNIRVHRFES